jgi:hypothetical protein
MGCFTTHRDRTRPVPKVEHGVTTSPKRNRRAGSFLTTYRFVTSPHQPVVALLGYSAAYHVLAPAVKGLTRMLG